MGRILLYRGLYMDLLQEVATGYAELFDKDYIYTLQNELEVKVYFAPKHFHHLIGFHKLRDIDVLNKAQNSVTYIFKNIIKGRIKYDDIKKSESFKEIEHRLMHFRQIKSIIEFEKVIIDFDPSKINTRLNADYILFKKSNDNKYLNLFLKRDATNRALHIPNTFIPQKTDYYTYDQKIINILSMKELPKITKRNKNTK